MSRRVRDVSATSEDAQQIQSRHREDSATATADRTSMSDTTSVRSGSPTGSLRSAATGFTNATGMTANTSVSQQQVAGNISGLQQQQPHFDAAKAMFTQADSNRDDSISREEFRQWAEPRNQANGQFHQQQQQHQNAQFANQNLGQQAFNTSFSGHSSQDTTLYFDYSAMEAYFVAYRSASDITAATLSGGFDDGDKKFDAVKAMFNQADVNHDSGISREEFRQWAEGGLENVSGQSHSSSQTTTNSGNNVNHAQLFAGATPEVANILHQSGLGQGLTNYS